MHYYNLKEIHGLENHQQEAIGNECYDFAQAVKRGLGHHQGLLFPRRIESVAGANNIEKLTELLKLPFQERSAKLLYPFVKESLTEQQLIECVETAFQFEAPVIQVTEKVSVLELFHGPTLAFKDFGARFMAQCLSRFNDQKVTILTATSGDTGAAVAHAFYNLPNVRVVILYPKGKISLLQEKLFTTMGGNIETLAIEGSFDDCQGLVKTAFNEKQLIQSLGLNSANSINVSRLLAQVCYYFEAFSQLTADQQRNLVVSVPSGNFGNITAGLMAKVLGLPIKRMIAATNANDTVPRYLQNGEWQPNPTIATLSNAMDVSQPNNWPRIEYLIDTHFENITDKSLIFNAASVSETDTEKAMYQLYQANYVAEPHSAVAFEVLNRQLQEDEYGLFLGTAHPAKFKASVEDILNCEIELPHALQQCADKKSLSQTMENNFSRLKRLFIEQFIKAAKVFYDCYIDSALINKHLVHLSVEFIE